MEKMDIRTSQIDIKKILKKVERPAIHYVYNFIHIEKLTNRANAVQSLYKKNKRHQAGKTQQQQGYQQCQRKYCSIYSIYVFLFLFSCDSLSIFLTWSPWSMFSYIHKQ